MARTSTYVNFPGQTEAAFAFYKQVFGTEYVGPVARMSDLPAGAPAEQLNAAEKKMILHITLPLLGGHLLMGTDAVGSMAKAYNAGNNMSINLEPDTRKEADRLFSALSAGGQVGMPMQDMFWGAYFGSFTDKFGMRWMVNCHEPKK